MGIKTQKSGKFLHCMFVALLVIVCAVLSLASIPFLQGTNTGQDLCVYTTEANANWRFMGEPCRLTSDAIGIFVFGYLTSFVFLFMVLGGVGLIIGKCMFHLQARCKKGLKRNEPGC